MNKYWKKRWLTALKSGRYKHGTGSLVYGKKGKQQHCCLGVLCNIYPGTNPIDPHKNLGYKYKNAGHSGILPKQLASKLGLSSDELGNLITLNDIAGNHDYDSVIKYIEEKL